MPDQAPKSLTLDEAKEQIQEYRKASSSAPSWARGLKSQAEAADTILNILSRVEMPSEEDRGWQDQDTKPPEFVGFKGVESATVEADGVEWHVGSEWAIVNGHTIAIECGQSLFTWVVFQDGEPGVVARSNPVTPSHTREEARRQAVEAACAMVRTEAQLAQKDEQ